MELKMNQVDFPQKIEFNFNELKQEITAKVGLYKNMVYTDDTIKQAKSDKAALNKFVMALDDERKKVKKQCLAPYEVFEKQIKELVGIVNEPINLIDSQVKTYEEKLKAEKLEKIKVYWEETEHPEWLKCNQIFDQKWLNTTFSLKKVQEAIDTRLAEINTHITTIGMLPDFAFEALETYKHTLDINSAISEGQRLADIQKRKAEAEKEAEAAKAAEEQKQAQPQAEPVVESIVEREPVSAAPLKQWVKFAACLTETEAAELAEFFRARNIEFKSV